jgi:tetratricopeptide (TPR) repeat protein
MTFCRKSIWLLVAVAVLLPAGCASQRGRMASKREVNTAQLLAAARQYEKEGNLQSAAGIYQHVLQFHPGNAEAREGLALVQQGKLRVDYQPERLLASRGQAIQQNPQAREHLARTQKSQRDQINDRMAELIAQAARNPTVIEVDPTPARTIVASTATTPARANPAPPKSLSRPDDTGKHQPQPIATAEHSSTSSEPSGSPAPIAQVAAVKQTAAPADVEANDASRPSPQQEIPADWIDNRWKGHSLANKCQDASTAVLAEVRKLERSTDATRKEGLTRLALMGPEAVSATPAVRRLLNDQNQLVCAHAAWAIWEIEGDAETALEVLEKSLTSKSAHVVQFACYTLCNLGEFARPAAPTLAMLVSDKDAYVRLHAAEALSRVGDADDASNAMDTLVLLLKDTDTGVRTLAAATLGQVELAEAELAVAALTAALDDEEAGVRSAAALSLGAFGTSAVSAVTRLEQLAAADQTSVRESATTALACIRL